MHSCVRLPQPLQLKSPCSQRWLTKAAWEGPGRGEFAPVAFFCCLFPYVRVAFARVSTYTCTPIMRRSARPAIHGCARMGMQACGRASGPPFGPLNTWQSPRAATGGRASGPPRAAACGPPKGRASGPPKGRASGPGRQRAEPSGRQKAEPPGRQRQSLRALKGQSLRAAMQEAEPAGRRTRVDEKGAAFRPVWLRGTPLGCRVSRFTRVHRARTCTACMHACHMFFSPCALFVSPLRSRQVTPRMQPLP